jgi:hypothetical protein
MAQSVTCSDTTAFGGLQRGGVGGGEGPIRAGGGGVKELYKFLEAERKIWDIAILNVRIEWIFFVLGTGDQRH